MANRRRRLSHAEVHDALTVCEGSVQRAAQLLGVSRQALHYRVKQDPKLVSKGRGIRRDLVDNAKIAIIDALRAGHIPTSRWFLDKFAEDRGYGRGEQAAAAYDARIDLWLVALGYTPKAIRAERKSGWLYYRSRWTTL